MTTTVRTNRKGPGRIDYSEAEQMLRAGATQQEVADKFGVTQPAVNAAIRRGRIKGIEYDRPSREESGVPWSPILPQHRDLYLVRMLRAARRREIGAGNNPMVDHQLDKFLEKMRELDAVVHYDPDTEQGFFRVPRRHGIDKGLVREPGISDDGRTIRR